MCLLHNLVLEYISRKIILSDRGWFNDSCFYVIAMNERIADM